MLAAELFLANKKTRRNLDAINMDPIKKIFMTRRTAVVDNTALEQFGKQPKTKASFLQRWLTMPYPTTESKVLNLPDKTSGKRPRLPYVVLNGRYTRGKRKKGNCFSR